MAINHGNRNSGSINYATIIGAKLAVKANKDDPFAVERRKDDDSIVYETYPDSISGMIAGGGFVTKEMPDKKKISNVVLKLKDDDGLYVINLPYSPTNARVMQQFAKRIPNIDTNKEIEIICFPDSAQANKEYKTPVLLIKQEGKVVPFAFTKDNPGDLPQPFKEEDETGAITWNWKKHNKFLIDLTNDFLSPFNSASKASATPTVSTKEEKRNDNIPSGQNQSKLDEAKNKTSKQNKPYKAQEIDFDDEEIPF